MTRLGLGTYSFADSTAKVLAFPSSSSSFRTSWASEGQVSSGQHVTASVASLKTSFSQSDSHLPFSVVLELLCLSSCSFIAFLIIADVLVCSRAAPWFRSLSVSGSVENPRVLPFFTLIHLSQVANCQFLATYYQQLSPKPSPAFWCKHVQGVPMVMRVDSTPFYDPDVRRRRQPAARVLVQKPRTKQPPEAEYSDLPYSDFKRMGGACWSKRKTRASIQTGNESEKVMDRRKA